MSSQPSIFNAGFNALTFMGGNSHADSVINSVDTIANWDPPALTPASVKSAVNEAILFSSGLVGFHSARTLTATSLGWFLIHAKTSALSRQSTMLLSLLVKVFRRISSATEGLEFNKSRLR